MKYRYWIYGSLILLGIGLDQFTKQLIVDYIHGPNDFQHILPVLSIVRTHNTGVSFGMLSALNLGPWFYGVLVVGIVGFLAYMLFTNSSKLLQAAFAFMISGALGNLIDRFMRGYVVDFISVHWFNKYHFYVFNVADIFISCGAGLIILEALIEKRKSK
jgi:signal peptidase II